MWKITALDRGIMESLRVKGWSLREIGQKFSVSPDCVRYNLLEKVRTRRSETSKAWRERNPLTPEKKAEKKEWYRKWFKEKYNNDEEFRKRFIKKVSD